MNTIKYASIMLLLLGVFTRACAAGTPTFSVTHSDTTFVTIEMDTFSRTWLDVYVTREKAAELRRIITIGKHNRQANWRFLVNGKAMQKTIVEDATASSPPYLKFPVHSPDQAVIMAKALLKGH